MIRYYYCPEHKDYLAVKVNPSFESQLPNDYICACSLKWEPTTVKIYTISKRYMNQLEPTTKEKIPVDWQDALSIINYIG